LRPLSGITIAFLGQCHTSGYPGVPPDRTFPQVCRRTVERRRPGITLQVVLEPYEHPLDLKRALYRASRLRPEVIVIEVVGWLAIKGREGVDLSRLPAGVRSAYQRARHFRHVSYRITSRLPKGADLIYRVQTGGYELASALLRSLVPRWPRPTIAEYERCLDGALRAARVMSGVRVAIQGPGAPNLALDARGLAPDALERYRSVEGMARRIAAAHGALYVDRWDTVSTGFFLPGSIRPAVGGHSTWGYLLAEKLMAEGLV